MSKVFINTETRDGAGNRITADKMLWQTAMNNDYPWLPR